MDLAQDIGVLKTKLAEGPGDLQWVRDLCVLCRRIMHHLVLSPTDEERIREAYDLFERSVVGMRKAETAMQESAAKEQVRLRIRNVEMRVCNLGRLQQGKPLEPAEELIALSRRS